jgi:hypothetical protein
MKARSMVVAAMVLIGVTTVGRTAVPLREADGAGKRNHAVYVGIGYGPVELEMSDQQRQVSGIDFTFDADADDLGGLFYIGGWITDHVGAELGTRTYGSVDIPFTFDNPHDNTSGTGESEVSINGFAVSVMLGFDIGRDIQIVCRAGALTWKEEFDSRFDIPGQPAIVRDMELSGTGPLLGVAITYRFTPGWQLEGRYEYASLDEDDLSLLTVGLSYDFIGLLRE